ncbi:hypothetical protein EYM_00460 [Ignicoccus islandicus DSM 13165]|uniref:Uncharacterized protein n=1 Tax=Ignicoccus islandicus DSM 13165 TaxID=940295 RepID=A0A0U2WMC9_9CREN|nr:DNA double-strand break repair nuclease NurA [Ignicoccus islandicus]ALU12113.1 hypothetical protein EYM_00460 [Ignicoccus islandicus DSM 13165]
MSEGDIFLDILFKRLQVKEKPELKVPKIGLKEPEVTVNEIENFYAVDGGGGLAKLDGGRTFYVARAVATSREDIIRDLRAEVTYWHSKPLLEAMRSEVELKVALSAPGNAVVMDGSYYTMVTKWMTRILRIALMRAKLSEIVSFQPTISALNLLNELLLRKKIVFIAKNPSFKFFKNYYILRKMYEETGDEKYFLLMKEPLLNKKDLLTEAKRKSIREYVLLLLNSAVTDADLLEGEGLSSALELPLPKQLRKFASPSKWNEVSKMAAEYYELSVGESPRFDRFNVCNLRVPRIWWLKKGKVFLTIEELSEISICALTSIREREIVPNLALRILGNELEYPPLLEVAHMLSTLSSSQLLSYVNLLSTSMNIGIDGLREELISLSRSK